MPFHDRADQTLELGGIVFFFIWPLILCQIIAAFIPVTRLVARNPVGMWIVLCIGGYAAISIDIAALRLGFN